MVMRNNKNTIINQINKEKEDLYQELQLNTLVSKLAVYEVEDERGPLTMVRHGKIGDGGYVVPEIALQEADVLLGYGIADDISFEEQFSDKYKKPSIGFDCGTEKIAIKNPLCTFVRECITNNTPLYSSQTNSVKFSTYSEQISRMNFDNKKVFIKMDIEGAEYEAFADIYKHANNITGIVLEMHFVRVKETAFANKLLSELEKDFHLVHVHGNNCAVENFTTLFSSGKIPKALELTFINKKLVKRAKIAQNQKHPSPLDTENCPTKSPYNFEIFRTYNNN